MPFSLENLKKMREGIDLGRASLQEEHEAHLIDTLISLMEEKEALRGKIEHEAELDEVLEHGKITGNSPIRHVLALLNSPKEE